MLQRGAGKRHHGTGVALLAAMPVLKSVHEARSVEAFVRFGRYQHRDMTEVRPSTSWAAAVMPYYLQRELLEIGLAINPSKTTALPPKGHVSTPEYIVLLGSIGVRIAEGCIGGLGVPIGNDAGELESAMRMRCVLRDGWWSRTTRAFRYRLCRTKQSGLNLSATSSMVRRTAHVAHVDRAMDPELALSACQMAGINAMRVLDHHFIEFPLNLVLPKYRDQPNYGRMRS